MTPTLDETPYRDGQTFCAEERDEALAWAAWWRGAFFYTLTLLGGMILLAWYLGSLPRLKPYYVEVSNDGTTRVVGPAPESYRPQHKVVERELREFIGSLRRRSQDKKLMADTWSEQGIYAHVTPRGRKALNEAVIAIDPLMEKELVSIQFQRILRRTEHTYDIQWVEKRHTQKLELASIDTYSGLFTWVRFEPKTKDEIDNNPLGIFWDTWPYAKE